MSKSSALLLKDYREIHRLVGECRELGDDATTWQRHLIEQLLGLTGSSIGMFGELAGFRSMQPSYLGMTDWGWETDSDRACFFTNHAEFVKDPRSSETMKAYHRRMIVNDGICVSRTELFDDRSWRATRDYSIILDPVRVDNVLWCLRSLPGVAADETSGINLMRSRGRRDFGARDRAIVQETQAALVRLIGGPLARYTDPSPKDLVPQVRRALRCLPG